MELTPMIDKSSINPIYLQIYDYIRKEIIAGRIEADCKLPSIRRLSQYLNISRTPVALAYDQLLAEGYIKSKPRSGYYAENIESIARSHHDLEPNKMSAASNYSPIHHFYHSYQNDAIKYDFGYGTIDLHHFPITKWRKFMNRSLLPEYNFHLLYGDIQGESGLREEIASYLHQNRGVRCSPDQIVIGAGTFHSLDLLFQLIQHRTTSIAVESSVHVGVKALLNKFPFQVETLELELDGINLNNLKKKEVQAIYLTPSYQFPYGMTLSINKRIKLLKYATENEIYIIENDYDGEFRYNNRPIPSLQSLDNNGRVIYLGTFSKSLTPSFRISYLVLPMDLLSLFHLGNHSYDQHASPIFQTTLQWFMESGDFERHMRKMRTLYQKKHEVLISRFSDIFEDKIEIVGAGAGLHIVIKVKNDMDELKLIETAKQFGVSVYPTSIYKIENQQEQDNMLLLGFGGLSETEIEEGLRLLKIAWFPKEQ